MKITQKKFKEWFPRDDRFLHFCAKYYGYSFRNDEVVEDARFIALKAITKWYNDGKEFDDEKHMTGLVMNSFRYAILHAYKMMDRRDKNKISTESDMIYGDGAEEFNKFLQLAVSKDKPYSNVMELINECIENDMDPIAAASIRGFYIENKSYREICIDLDCNRDKVRAGMTRGLKKLKRKLDESFIDKPIEEAKPKNIREVVPQVRRVNRSKSTESCKASEDSSSKAMSFLYS